MFQVVVVPIKEYSFIRSSVWSYVYTHKARKSVGKGRTMRIYRPCDVTRKLEHLLTTEKSTGNGQKSLNNHNELGNITLRQYIDRVSSHLACLSVVLSHS